MDKIFSPSKWFVLFCALLIVIWAALQQVSNMHLKGVAKIAARQIFTWEFPEISYKAVAEIKDAEIVKRTATDAIVKVEGRQALSPLLSRPGQAPLPAQTIECAARLTFYRLNDRWTLGKVEFQ